MSEHETLARELHAMRAEPDPAFARDLDRRAAGWLRPPERRSWRIAAPAVAAAAAGLIAVILLVGDSEKRSLGVRVVSQPAAEGLSAAPEQDSRATDEGAVAIPSRVDEGESVVVPYAVAERAHARVAFGDLRAETEVPAGTGRLEISTREVDPGTHDLEVAIGSLPVQRAEIEIVPR